MCGSTDRMQNHDRDEDGSSSSSSQSVTIVEEKNQFHPVPHKDDLSEEEKVVVWFQKNEFADIKTAYKQILKAIDSGEELPDAHAGRGLEDRTVLGKKQFSQNCSDAFNAVLDEQDRQWEEEDADDEAISGIYSEHSIKAAAAAAARAREDECIAWPKEDIDELVDDVNCETKAISRRRKSSSAIGRPGMAKEVNFSMMMPFSTRTIPMQR
jgi:hypothetical protein